MIKITLSVMEQIEKKEFLISELKRFYEEEGFVPTQYMMSPKYGYPSSGSYTYQFGSFNEALEISGLKINRKHQTGTLDGNETCSYCGRHADEIPNFTHWRYHDGVRYCQKHGNSGGKGKPDYVKGILDINSSTGRGRAGEITVVKALKIGDEHDCALISMGYPFDLYHKEYKKINVKTSVLSNNSNLWQFTFNAKKIADTYICIGMSLNTKNVEHVWVVPNINGIRNLTVFGVINTQYSLSTHKKWEVNVKIYDIAWKEMLDNYTNNGCKIFGKKSDI